MTYDKLVTKYEGIVNIVESNLEYGLKGAYSEGTILIEKSLSRIEKKCILAEELGHHFTSSGEIVDLRVVKNIKQERKAHVWAVKEIVSRNDFIRAVRMCRNKFEIAEYLEVSAWFLEDVYKVYNCALASCFEFSEELCY